MYLHINFSSLVEALCIESFMLALISDKADVSMPFFFFGYSQVRLDLGCLMMESRGV